MDLISWSQLRDVVRDRRRLLPLLIAVCGYAFAGITVPVLLLFSGGHLLPKTVDDGPHVPLGGAVGIDLALIALFGLQHSGMARPSFKAWLTRRVPDALERTVYIFMVCAVVWILILAWQPIPYRIWSIDGVGGRIVDATFWLGIVLVYVATLLLDHFHLLGLRQAYREYVIRVPDATVDRLQVQGPYRLVRHPLMTGLLLTFWAASEMSLGHLLWAVGLTGYILLGTALEERDLIARFGHAYRLYAARVPAFFPSPLRVLRRKPPSPDTKPAETETSHSTENATPWSSTTQ
ncbi:isoprenylcysteine carboxylmethyltransferase family protein [Rhodococcus fascians]|nr:isoprenylcysteine carboxylmethyltransferase family protein [Rhodococcus fascians]MBY4237425.1 isoprenylcysteine carboxylmethyltransferase family protein [Rhodococcus fascians]MBY4253104.1 isoprenylcysteine carboxylmethyltransferase family protein [Rhodococcus fascians]MBY4268656.1 isoprenylcysteine carboxylmethyltransferase family protein [Rhodococcus fascians]